MTSQALEIAQGERFKFGENWKRFLGALNDNRILEAEKSLKEMLQVENLTNKSFLDVGSGSGLFSLAAKRLGARVHSFDYDPQSFACTRELKHRYFAADADWTVEEGSVLDVNYLRSLGKFDVVYSWGVLHHTGKMWQALKLACNEAQARSLGRKPQDRRRERYTARENGRQPWVFRPSPTIAGSVCQFISEPGLRPGLNACYCFAGKTCSKRLLCYVRHKRHSPFKKLKSPD